VGRGGLHSAFPFANPLLSLVLASRFLLTHFSIDHVLGYLVIASWRVVRTLISLACFVDDRVFEREQLIVSIVGVWDWGLDLLACFVD